MWAQYDFGDGPEVNGAATVLFCLRKRPPGCGNALRGRFLLVTPCIAVCHRESTRCGVHGRIADPVRGARTVGAHRRLFHGRPRTGRAAACFGLTCAAEPGVHPLVRPGCPGCRRLSSKQNEYLLLSEGGCHGRIEHRSARSGWPSAPPAESCGTGRGWSSRGSLEIAKALAATGVPGAVMGIPAVLIDDGTRRRALPRQARKDCFVVPLVRQHCVEF